MASPAKPVAQRVQHPTAGKNQPATLDLHIPDLATAQAEYDAHKAIRPHPLLPEAPREEHEAREAWLRRDEWLLHRLDMAKSALMNHWKTVYKAEDMDHAQAQPAKIGSGAWQAPKSSETRRMEYQSACDALAALEPRSEEWKRLRQKCYELKKKLNRSEKRKT